MAAFDCISSGIPDLDAALAHIRLGDNVAFRVSDLEEFHLFLDPFVERQEYLPAGRNRNTGAASAVSVLDARGRGLNFYTDVRSSKTLVVFY